MWNFRKESEIASLNALLSMVTLGGQRSDVVSSNCESCSSRDSSAVEDEGPVHAPDCEEDTRNDLDWFDIELRSKADKSVMERDEGSEFVICPVGFAGVFRENDFPYCSLC